MTTHVQFLLSLAADLSRSQPHNAARLIEVAHDMKRLEKWADQLADDAMAEARRADAEIKERASAALYQICKDHER